MNYSVEELFVFLETDDGYSIEKYLKRDDPSVTELEIPAEYNGAPIVEVCGFHTSEFIKRVAIPPSVREICGMAFHNCTALEAVELSEGLEEIRDCAFEGTRLKSITLPKSLKKLSWGAIELCPELERVEFGKEPLIGLNNFRWCPKLPPEFAVMGMVCSTDLTAPIHNDNIQYILLELNNFLSDLFRADVFEILAKNNCFRECDLNYLFRRIINAGKAKLFPLAEKYGMLENAALVDSLISFSAENQKVELTAYLLELKKRKFGFNGGNDFEL